ncbi:TolC family protein [Calothrix sp. UHCC 0171]|uniref:TolC family protein n=1 Tax=Calothrix sp. UHCC 0171 TaxID=3110245 RepID=UPI002B1EEACD|nr:TolC family protein [Calothrix sp. UHCC 0171]MEA5570821.1 TolC family protein [Calothrix sp. UHCC 0171]
MNFSRFLLHSSRIAFAPQFLFWSIAIAICIPTSAQGAEAKNLSVVQKNLGENPANTTSPGKAADLLPVVIPVPPASLSVANATKQPEKPPHEKSPSQREVLELKNSPDAEKNSHVEGEKLQPKKQPIKLQPSRNSEKKSGYHDKKHRHEGNSSPLLVPSKPEEVQIQENQPLTLEQALEIARNSNPQLKTAILELERSRAGLKEAEAALYPTFGINGSLTESKSAQDSLSVNSGIAPPGSDKARTAFTGQAEINYNIYTSGRRSASIREAKERVKISELDVETRFQEIRLSVTSRYYDLQAADEQLRISAAAVENAQASLRDAQALERAGVGTKFDVLRSQVNLANSQQDYTNARSRQQISQRQLVSLLNLPQTVNISTAESVKIAGLWQQSLEESIVNAYQYRQELQQRLAERNIGEQRRKFALSQLGPQVALVATYDVLDQYNDNTGVTDGYSVGVKARWNIFDGGAAKAQASQAKANIAIAESNFTNQRNQIRFEVEQYYAQLQSNLENVQTATAAVEQAQEALRLARLRFQAGVGTQTDVIAAENDLTRAQGNRVTAILDYNRAFANLQRAVSAKV